MISALQRVHRATPSVFLVWWQGLLPFLPLVAILLVHPIIHAFLLAPCYSDYMRLVHAHQLLSLLWYFTSEIAVARGVPRISRMGHGQPAIRYDATKLAEQPQRGRDEGKGL